VVERLKPNGVLLIWDFLPHSPVPKGHHQQENQHQYQHERDDDHHHHDSDHHHRGAEKEEVQKADTDTEAAHSHVLHSVMHHGFSEERIREIFTAAGAGKDFKLEVIGGGLALNPHHAHGHTRGKGHGDRHGHEDSMHEIEDAEQDEHVEKEGLRRQVFFARGTKAA
jgi:hypothetical protein